MKYWYEECVVCGTGMIDVETHPDTYYCPKCRRTDGPPIGEGGPAEETSTGDRKGGCGQMLLLEKWKSNQNGIWNKWTYERNKEMIDLCVCPMCRKTREYKEKLELEEIAELWEI